MDSKTPAIDTLDEFVTHTHAHAYKTKQTNRRRDEDEEALKQMMRPITQID